MDPQQNGGQVRKTARFTLGLFLLAAACVFVSALSGLLKTGAAEANPALIAYSALFLVTGLLAFFLLSRASSGPRDPAETGDFTRPYSAGASEYTTPRPSAGWALAAAVLVLAVLVCGTCYYWLIAGQVVQEAARAVASQKARPPASVPLAPEPAPLSAMETTEAAAPDEPDQARLLAEEGRSLVRQGDFPAAESRYRERIKILRHTGEGVHPALPMAYCDLARALFGQKRLDEAEVYFHQAAAECEKTSDPKGAAIADSMEGLVALYRAQGRNGDAARLLNEAAKVRRKFSEKREPFKPSTDVAKQAAAGPGSQDLVPSPAYGEVSYRVSGETRLPRTKAKAVLSRDFQAVQSTGGGRWIPKTDGLSNLRPQEITREPKYQGAIQRYGALRLGTGGNNVFHFAFDLVPGPHPILYFDSNQNGDLTDDGPALTNQGSGVFATQIALPLSRIVPGKNLPGPYLFWFYADPGQWDDGRASHYSLTQFRGRLNLGGKSFLATVMDTGKNDGDFTNDGIFIDVNGDGKIQQDSEWFRPGQPAVIKGKEYLIETVW